MGMSDRACPVCGTVFDARSPDPRGRGRPRVYCRDRCRWLAGWRVQARRRREEADPVPAGFDDMDAWLDRNFPLSATLGNHSPK